MKPKVTFDNPLFEDVDFKILGSSNRVDITFTACHVKNSIITIQSSPTGWSSPDNFVMKGCTFANSTLILKSKSEYTQLVVKLC